VLREAARARRVAVVIPVYCERDSVPTLVREIFAQPLDADLQVWVIDDNSPDGTAAAVEELRPELPGLELLSRGNPEGRGAAVLEAFTRLLELENPPDLIVEMDGDGSHEAASIAPIVAAAGDADLVIGSRYVVGGGADLSGRRRLLSRLANGFAATVLGLPYADCSTGYRCYRRETLAALDLESIRCGGHATHLELLMCIAAGSTSSRCRSTTVPAAGANPRSLSRRPYGWQWCCCGCACAQKKLDKAIDRMVIKKSIEHLIRRRTC